MTAHVIGSVAAITIACGLAAAESARPARVTGTTGCAASWHVAANPSVPEGELNAVSAAAPDDVWAVGESPSVFAGTQLPHRTLIEHWDGAGWTIVTGAPSAGELADVAAVDAKDVWVLGSTNDHKAIVEHWDGMQWNRTPEPWRLTPTAITASSGDVWIAGDNGLGAMILHWNGIRWLRVARRQKAELDDIRAVSANDIWAVGNDNERRLLSLHWNGSRWKALPMSAGHGHDLPVGLFSVAATSATDVWAVGSAHVTGLNGYDADPIVRHWDGNSWRVIPPTADEATLLAVAATSAGPWVSGIERFSFATSGGDHSFLGVRSGSTWKYTPTPRRVINSLTTDSSGAVWAVGLVGRGIDGLGNGFPTHTTPLIEHYAC